MADNVLEYKCKNCGGFLEFNSEKQLMVCPYCDSTFSPEEIKGQEQGTYVEKQVEYNEEFITEMKHYICKSCGGEIDVNENSVADFCPFCSRPVIMDDRVSSFLKPDFVIPFKVNKETAMAKYVEFAKARKRLVPREFLAKTKPDNIKGMYVPYWLYSADTNTHAVFEGEIRTSWTSGNYRYTKTDYYNLYRACENAYKHVPVDGSSNIDNKYTESIEPYDYKENTAFASAYLSGFFAEKYDQDSKECQPIAHERMKNSDVTLMRNGIHGYSSVSLKNASTETSNMAVKYGLFPVWFMSAEYKGKIYQFALNGQTGKCVGSLPVSKGRAFGLWAEIAGIVGAITALLSILIYNIK